MLQWDHLHMCGEYKEAEYLHAKGMGSPPHVWRIQQINDLKVQGLQDHLHMCGEYDQLKRYFAN